jgi:hypothetical protein
MLFQDSPWLSRFNPVISALLQAGLTGKWKQASKNTQVDIFISEKQVCGTCIRIRIHSELLVLDADPDL